MIGRHPSLKTRILKTSVISTPWHANDFCCTTRQAREVALEQGFPYSCGFV